jgi:hypothetical protein
MQVRGYEQIGDEALDEVYRYAPVSPASPEKAMRLCLLRARVLSSLALRIVTPRMAAFEAATSVKSLPVRSSRTSIFTASDSKGGYMLNSALVEGLRHEVRSDCEMVKL